MKILKLFTLISLFSLAFASCETYEDQKVEYSPLFPLCGQWVVSIHDAATGSLIPDGDGYTLYTYNTSSNVDNIMWVRLSNSANPFGVLGKVNCSVAEKSFSIVKGVNTFFTTDNELTITEGKVVLNGFDTPSGGKSDFISFKMKPTTNSTVTYLIKGFRRTAWPEDMP